MTQPAPQPNDPVLAGCRSIQEAVQTTAVLMRDFREQAEAAICQAAREMKQARKSQEEAWRQALQTAKQWVGQPAERDASSGSPPGGADDGRAGPQQSAAAPVAESKSAASPAGSQPVETLQPGDDHPVSREVLASMMPEAVHAGAAFARE